MAFIVTTDGHACLEATQAIDKFVSHRNALAKVWTSYLSPFVRDVILKGKKTGAGLSDMDTSRLLSAIVEEARTIKDPDAENYRECAELFKATHPPEAITHMYSLGDILGYGADAARVLDWHIEKQQSGFLRGVVLGNHDFYVRQMLIDLGVSTSVDDVFLERFRVSRRIPSGKVVQGTLHSLTDCFSDFRKIDFDAVDTACDAILNSLKPKNSRKSGITRLFAPFAKSSNTGSDNDSRRIVYDNVYELNGVAQKLKDAVIQHCESDIHLPYLRWRFLRSMSDEVRDSAVVMRHTDPTDLESDDGKRWRYLVPRQSIQEGKEWHDSYRQNADPFLTMERCLETISSSKELSARYSGVKLYLIGHVHLPYSVEKNNVRIVSVRSLGQPRDGNPVAGAAVVYDDLTVEDVAIPADFVSAQEKIVEAGLPARFKFL